MEYIPLFFFAWLLVCLPAIIVTLVANGRRRRETAKLNDKIVQLTRQLESLERRGHAPTVPQAAVAPVASPAMKISAEETRAAFPHHTTSMLLMVAYWAVFRCSYVWRKVESHEEESVSTIAGLLNPLLFLGVMKYQSFHPQLAFYALLGLGAAEIIFGQLPV
jgi:hypothetical protein